jgi:chromosome segregation ATPase
VADDRDDLLAHVAELERRDQAVAEHITVLTALAERAGSARARAVEIRHRLDELPAELAGVEHAEGEARTREHVARAEETEAQRRLDQLMASRRAGEEERARARQVLQDAREAVSDAEHRVERLQAKRAELHDLEQALRAEADGLVVEARDVAAALREAPRLADAAKGEPGTALDDIDEWGGRARAGLFVAQGTLEAERERIVVEANALAAALLGEDLGAASVALVRRRVEAALEA